MNRDTSFTNLDLSKKKILSSIGLMARARKIVSGTDFVVESLRKGSTYYVFLAKDASENTKKKITDKCHYYHVEFCMSFTSEELSNSIGKCGYFVIGIQDPKMAESLRIKINEIEG